MASPAAFARANSDGHRCPMFTITLSTSRNEVTVIDGAKLRPAFARANSRGGEEGRGKDRRDSARGEKNPPPVRRRAPSAESIVSGPNPYPDRSVIYGIVRRIAPAGGARPSRGSGNGTAWGCCHSSYRARVRARASRQPGPPACQGQPTRPNQRALGLAHPCARQLCRRLPEGTGHFLCSAPPPCGPPHEGIGERHSHDKEDPHL